MHFVALAFISSIADLHISLSTSAISFSNITNSRFWYLAFGVLKNFPIPGP